MRDLRDMEVDLQAAKQQLHELQLESQAAVRVDPSVSQDNVKLKAQLSTLRLSSERNGALESAVMVALHLYTYRRVPKCARRIGAASQAFERM